MGGGFLPNFFKFYQNSEIYITEADERGAPNLEPWIQWYSLHTGLPHSTHGVFHLTDGPRANHQDIWGRLLDGGLSVWNCGSMNAKAHRRGGEYYLPDPWCEQQAPSPAELSRFSSFVSRQVKEYSNRTAGSTVADAIRFAQFMLSHGLRGETILRILRQLQSEILSSGRSSWKRVALMDLLQFDLFRFYYIKGQPDFSTFFVNSTAHLQHSYWRHMQPDLFTVTPDAREIERFRNAILFGYQKMDHLLDRFMRLADDDTILVLATALSQQPFLKYESIGGQRFYRPRRIEALFNLVGIRPTSIEPVMTHQFMARFGTVGQAQDAKRVLSAMQVDGQTVFGFDAASEQSIYFGCHIRTPLAQDASLLTGEDAKSLPFFDLFYEIEALKSGCHHPDGCLWIRRGKHVVHKEKVSILDVFPTILDLFGLDQSGCMGRSLASPPTKDFERSVAA